MARCISFLWPEMQQILLGLEGSQHTACIFKGKLKKSKCCGFHSKAFPSSHYWFHVNSNILRGAMLADPFSLFFFPWRANASVFSQQCLGFHDQFALKWSFIKQHLLQCFSTPSVQFNVENSWGFFVKFFPRSTNLKSQSKQSAIILKIGNLNHLIWKKTPANLLFR